MKERPILFSAPMVRALLDGRKTQTRRLVKQVPSWQHFGRDIMDWSLSGIHQAEEDDPYGYAEKKDRFYLCVQTEVDDNSHKEIFCHYGKPGDRLWVREAWKTAKMNDALSPKQMVQACRDAGWKSGKAWAPIEYLADGSRQNWDTFPSVTGRYRNSRFMPRDYSRITLDIAEVRVQRLQEIGPADAVAEGLAKLPATGRYVIAKGDQYFGGASRNPVEVYQWLWESINGAGSWAANPWVWALTFKVIADD